MLIADAHIAFPWEEGEGDREGVNRTLSARHVQYTAVCGPCLLAYYTCLADCILLTHSLFLKSRRHMAQHTAALHDSSDAKTSLEELDSYLCPHSHERRILIHDNIRDGTKHIGHECHRCDEHQVAKQNLHDRGIVLRCMLSGLQERDVILPCNLENICKCKNTKGA